MKKMTTFVVKRHRFSLPYEYKVLENKLIKINYNNTIGDGNFIGRCEIIRRKIDNKVLIKVIFPSNKFPEAYRYTYKGWIELDISHLDQLVNTVGKYYDYELNFFYTDIEKDKRFFSFEENETQNLVDMIAYTLSTDDLSSYMDEPLGGDVFGTDFHGLYSINKGVSDIYNSMVKFFV